MNPDADSIAALILSRGGTRLTASTVTAYRATLDQVQQLLDVGAPVEALPHLVNYRVTPDEAKLAVGQHFSEWQVFAKAVFVARATVLQWHALLGPNWTCIEPLVRRGVPLDAVRAVHKADPEVAQCMHLVLGELNHTQIHMPYTEIASWVSARLIRVRPEQRGLAVRVESDQIRVWRSWLGERAHFYAAAGLRLQEAVALESSGLPVDDEVRLLAALRGAAA